VDQNSDLPGPTDFARIENQLFTRIGANHRRQVVRHRLIAAAVVIALAGAGVAAGTTATGTQQGRFAYCYGGPTTHSQLAQLILNDQSDKGSNPAAGSTRAREANVLAICAGAWRNGVFNKASASGPFAVPRLQACVRDDLAVSVFRRGDSTRSAAAFCENLGLSAP
jgi:hypothetical protein